MENNNVTKMNVGGRKPFSVLYSSGVNRAPLATIGGGKSVLQSNRDVHPPTKPSTFIFCDQQDENSSANNQKPPDVVEKKPVFTLYEEEAPTIKQEQQQLTVDDDDEKKTFRPFNDDDENARADFFGNRSSSGSDLGGGGDGGDTKNGINASMVLMEDTCQNTVDFESIAGGSTKTATFVMYEDHEMMDKSRTSVMSVTMRSVGAVGSSSFMAPVPKMMNPREARRDVLESCRDYAPDIHGYLRNMERHFRPKSHYIRKQPEITMEMRTVLVDWLVDVSREFDLNQETLHLAVAYTDRFLSIMAVRKEHLQLLGIASMMIAAKYEEIYPPDLQEFVYITDDTYSKREVLQMEQIVLKTLCFNLSAPTSYIFLISNLNSPRAGQRCEYLAKYLCDLALLDYGFLVYFPSMIAASCTFLAHYVTDGIPAAIKTLEVSGYEFKDIYQCVEALLTIFKNATDHAQQAIRDKYKEDKFCRVALLEPPENLPSLDSL